MEGNVGEGTSRDDGDVRYGPSGNVGVLTESMLPGQLGRRKRTRTSLGVSGPCDVGVLADGVGGLEGIPDSKLTEQLGRRKRTPLGVSGPRTSTKPGIVGVLAGGVGGKKGSIPGLPGSKKPGQLLRRKHTPLGVSGLRVSSDSSGRF